LARRADAEPPFFFAVFFVAFVRLRFSFGLALRLLIVHLPRGSSRLRLSYAAI
jgi:hypothetical protein